MTEVLKIENVQLIPPRGVLADLRDIVERKVRGKDGFEWVNERLRIPVERSFEVEMAVDDECEVCPHAVAIVSEIAAKYRNVTVKIYNIDYVEPPFEVNATPAFRINGKVRFNGVPLDPREVNRFFTDMFSEAYVTTHPRLKELIERIEGFAKKHGYVRNPNDRAYISVIAKLLRNIDRYGHPFCPCRPLKRVEPTTPEKLYEANRDKVCPCIYVHSDIKERGHCLCGLFWTREKARQYIANRVQSKGWIIKEIENLQELLNELKRRVVTGRGRILAETIIQKMQEIYMALED